MSQETPRRRDVLKSLGAGGAALTGGGSALTGTSIATAASESSAETNVTILHDTHFHGRFENTFVEQRNIANYFGLMDDIAARRNHVVRIGNGDDLASSVLSAVFDGEHMVDALDAGGLTYDTYGNHDFDMGPDTLRRRVSESEFTWVSANVRDERTGDVFASREGAKRYDIRDMGDVPVGFTGLITPEAPEVTSVGEHTDVLDPVAAMRKIVPQMRRDGARVIVVLSHLASDVAERVAKTVGNIDVIAGDHAASVREEPKVVNDTLLSFAGDQFEYVGELTLHLQGQTLPATDHEFTLHPLTDAVADSAFEPNPAVERVVAQYYSELDDRLGVVIGRSTVALDTRTELVRRTESNMGNFVADGLRASVEADVALMNGGGIRTDTLYPAGEITKKRIVNILPFPNNVVELRVSGETLLAALENGVSRVEQLSGRFPQVSGMQYSYDPEKPAGNRIVSTMINSEPIDPGTMYRLATNDFVAGGGDGYNMLIDAPRLITANEGALLSDLIIDRVEALTPISPEARSRITRR